MPHTKFMVDDLARSGLVPTDLNSTASPSPFAPNSSLYKIPYWNLDGTPHPIMYRERLQHPAPDAGKYNQPSAKNNPNAKLGELTFPYFNPIILGAGMTWAQKIAARPHDGHLWVIVEGEKKAVCVGKYAGRLAIGIGGCWNGVVNVNGVYVLHPAFAFMQPGDRVEVVLDADLYTNHQVERAAGTLRRCLTQRGLIASFVLVPRTVKGIDDWLVTIPVPDRPAAFESLPRAAFDRGELREDRGTLIHHLGLPVNDKGGIIPNESSAKLVLTTHERYVGRVWVEDSDLKFMQTVGGPEPREVNDAFTAAQLTWFQSHINSQFRPSHVTGALRSLPNSDAFHRNAIQEYIKGLRWDGVPRLEEMFITGWRAADTPYTRAVGKAWLLSAVARAFRPGCKVDTMLVLEGAQGIGKSRSLAALGGRWYVETTTAMDNKDFLLGAHQSLILDLAELGSYKYQDFAMVKGLLSTAVDSIRPPYAAVTESRPRRFVIVATTNEDYYLRDITGNRRFWPMECGAKVDVDWVAANRDQLFAEAKVCFDAGDRWWIDDALTAPVQNARVAYDAWEGVIDGVLLAATAPTAPTLVLQGVPYCFVPSATLLTAIGEQKPTTGHFMRLSSLMKRHHPEWDKYIYNNPDKPLNVGGVMTPTVRGYRLPRSQVPVPNAPVAPVSPIVHPTIQQPAAAPPAPPVGNPFAPFGSGNE